MCDYSLMGLPNRLAVEGERLITYKFPTSSIGLAAPEDVRASQASVSNPPAGFWSRFRVWLNDSPQQPPVSAVCIPPGARLRLRGAFGCGSRKSPAISNEIVTFTQTSEAWNHYRDALRFGDGRVVLLQELGEGVRIQVLDLSLAEARQPVDERRYPSLV